MNLEQERAERRELFRGRFEEPPEVVPVMLNSVKRGAICRHWFMPNQSRFVFVGVLGGIAQVILENGVLTGLVPEALVVEIEPAPENFPQLIERIESFRREMYQAAWSGRE